VACVVYYFAMLIPSDFDKDFAHLCSHSTPYYAFNDSSGLAQPIDARVRIQTVSNGKSYPRRYPLTQSHYGWKQGVWKIRSSVMKGRHDTVCQSLISVKMPA
jgi:hypothetical protein